MEETIGLTKVEQQALTELLQEKRAKIKRLCQLSYDSLAEKFEIDKHKIMEFERDMYE